MGLRGGCPPLEHDSLPPPPLARAPPCSLPPALHAMVQWEGCDVAGYTTELSAQVADQYCSGKWGESYGRKRERIRGTSALLRRVRRDKYK